MRDHTDIPFKGHPGINGAMWAVGFIALAFAIEIPVIGLEEAHSLMHSIAIITLSIGWFYSVWSLRRLEAHINDIQVKIHQLEFPLD